MAELIIGIHCNSLNLKSAIYSSSNMKTLRDKIKLVKGDITTIKVDAVVNAANSSLMGGGGVDGAIHNAGGSAILEDCKKIVARQGGCKVGEAVITTAGNMPSKHVIHTVGPVWNGGERNEAQLLYNCYTNALALAVENGCKTIAFPNISTGVYGFPKDKAAVVATQAVIDFLMDTDNIEQVVFICFDNDNYYWIKESLDRILKL